MCVYIYICIYIYIHMYIYICIHITTYSTPKISGFSPVPKIKKLEVQGLGDLICIVCSLIDGTVLESWTLST